MGHTHGKLAESEKCRISFTTNYCNAVQSCSLRAVLNGETGDREAPQLASYNDHEGNSARTPTIEHYKCNPIAILSRYGMIGE